MVRVLVGVLRVLRLLLLLLLLHDDTEVTVAEVRLLAVDEGGHLVGSLLAQAEGGGLLLAARLWLETGGWRCRMLRLTLGSVTHLRRVRLETRLVDGVGRWHVGVNRLLARGGHGGRSRASGLLFGRFNIIENFVCPHAAIFLASPGVRGSRALLLAPLGDNGEFLRLETRLLNDGGGGR